MIPTFLKNFKRELEKLENISTEFSPPSFWYDTGNYALNKVLSGSYFKGIPQGRITSLCGPSAVGKSFIVCNILREAQKQDCYSLVLDSENALDPDFMKRVGIDVSGEKLTYVQVVTIQDVTSILSEFFKGYEKEYGRFNKTAPKILIVLDSLGNCLTDSENEKFEKGIQTGDQGQSAKMKKHLLRTLVSRLPRFNATMVLTDQVYPADPMAGDGLWAITNGVKYSASQIVLLTKLKLKDGDDVIGIRMKVENYKSRFVKPGTKITLRVPFTIGLSRTEGLLDYFIEEGIVTASGSWLTATINGAPKKFQRGDFTEELAEQLLKSNPEIAEGEKQFEELQLEPETLDAVPAVELLTIEEPT
jgi:recombination protein RecA